MKGIWGIFVKVVIPILLIIGICITAYHIFSKPVDELVNTVTNQAEKRIQDVQKYEKKVYDSMLDEIANEKLKYYIIMFGEFGILMLFGFHVIKIMLRIPTDAFISPEKYELISKEEAEAIRYIKDKLLELEVLKSNQLLTKDMAVRMIGYRKPHI
jgi:hypothetical protein